MANRTGTYVAFDGLGTVDPTQSDFTYYSLMQAWDANKDIEFHFTNSHDKTCAVRDDSKKATLKKRICERLSKSKNMVVILSEKTRDFGSMLLYEIRMAIDYYKIPLIVVYPDYEYILKPKLLSEYWPSALRLRIENKSARAIHVPFKKDILFDAISQFSVNDDPLQSPLHYYTKDAYKEFGIAIRG